MERPVIRHGFTYVLVDGKQISVRIMKMAVRNVKEWGVHND